MNIMTAFHGAYWIVLVAAFLSLATWESRKPARKLRFRESGRWGCHLLLMISDSFLLYGILRWSGSLAMAALVADSSFGVLNHSSIPFALRCLLTVLALDFTRFVTHRASHALPVLWRFHQIHHSDPDFDVSLAGRRHPVEAAFSAGMQLLAIAVLAPPVVGVFISELVTSFQNVFLHANADLPSGVARLVRKVFFTPDLHRIHHSDQIADQSRNFGDLLPVWDRLSGTFALSPGAGASALVLGLKEFPAERGSDILFLLTLPFRGLPVLPKPPVAAGEHLKSD